MLSFVTISHNQPTSITQAEGLKSALWCEYKIARKNASNQNLKLGFMDLLILEKLYVIQVPLIMIKVWERILIVQLVKSNDPIQF